MELKQVGLEETAQWLLSHQTQLEYSKQYLEGYLHMMNMYLLLHEGNEIGFVDLKTITVQDLSSHDDAEWIMEALQEDQEYCYIETLNICSDFHRQGYGRKIVHSLKKESAKPILVYCTADSYIFWYQQGFKGVNDDDYWMCYEEK